MPKVYSSYSHMMDPHGVFARLLLQRHRLKILGFSVVGIVLTSEEEASLVAQLDTPGRSLDRVDGLPVTIGLQHGLIVSEDRL